MRRGGGEPDRASGTLGGESEPEGGTGMIHRSYKVHGRQRRRNGRVGVFGVTAARGPPSRRPSPPENPGCCPTLSGDVVDLDF